MKNKLISLIELLWQPLKFILIVMGCLLVIVLLATISYGPIMACIYIVLKWLKLV